MGHGVELHACVIQQQGDDVADLFRRPAPLQSAHHLPERLARRRMRRAVLEGMGVREQQDQIGERTAAPVGEPGELGRHLDDGDVVALEQECRVLVAGDQPCPLGIVPIGCLRARPAAHGGRTFLFRRMADIRTASPSEILVRAPFEPFPHVVSKHARDRATHDAIIFLERGEAETERLSYGALEAVAASRAAGLAARGLSGRPVAIAMAPGAAFVGVFLGCLKAGAIAVPVPLADGARSTERLRAILADARPDAIVTDQATLPRLEAIAGGATLVTAGELEGARAEFPAPDADDPALIQYTSGSTSAPKGIVITHGNLAANQEMIRAAFAMDEHCIGVNWLPHFHDMGLMGAILQPLFVGGTAVLMPPRAFVQKPLRWLRAIERYAATCAGGPCFGYDLCVRTIAPEHAAALDLSSWETAFCGAEPIRAPGARGVRAALRRGRVPARSLPSLLRPGRGDADRVLRETGPGCPGKDAAGRRARLRLLRSGRERQRHYAARRDA